MEEVLPRAEKRRKNRRSHDPRVVEARQNIKKVCAQVREGNNITEIARVREKLKEVYNTILEEEVDEPINR